LTLLIGAAFVVATLGACTTRGGTGAGGLAAAAGAEQTTTVRYGPVSIPGANQPASGPFALIAPFLGAQAETGMVWNLPRPNVKKPCDNCSITGFQSGLLTASGQPANVNNGLWLHHMVVLESGAGHRDATCPTGLQQVAIGKSGAERIFASGNERTAGDFGEGQYGVKLESGTQLNLLLDLMNMNQAATPVYVTVTYKWVPGTNVKPVKPLWFDANQCSISEVRAKAQPQYTIQSGNWTSTVAGKFLFMAGHLHDGGSHLTIEQNGRAICDSKVTYGGDPAYERPNDMNHSGGSATTMPGMPGMDHGGGGDMWTSISNMSACHDNGTIKAGDRMHITGYYDTTQHPGMMNNKGQPEEVMAIAIVYVGQG